MGLSGCCSGMGVFELTWLSRLCSFEPAQPSLPHSIVVINAQALTSPLTVNDVTVSAAESVIIYQTGIGHRVWARQIFVAHGQRPVWQWIWSIDLSELNTQHMNILSLSLVGPKTGSELMALRICQHVLIQGPYLHTMSGLSSDDWPQTALCTHAITMRRLVHSEAVTTDSCYRGMPTAAPMKSKWLASVFPSHSWNVFPSCSQERSRSPIGEMRDQTEAHQKGQDVHLTVCLGCHGHFYEQLALTLLFTVPSAVPETHGGWAPGEEDPALPRIRRVHPCPRLRPPSR